MLPQVDVIILQNLRLSYEPKLLLVVLLFGLLGSQLGYFDLAHLFELVYFLGYDASAQGLGLALVLFLNVLFLNGLHWRQCGAVVRVEVTELLAKTFFGDDLDLLLNPLALIFQVANVIALQSRHLLVVLYGVFS